MGSFLNSITQIVQNFGPKGIFLAGILEQIIVPIPSPLVPMSGGFFLITKELSFLVAFKKTILYVAVPFALGSTLGATAIFLIAFKGGIFLINKLEKFLDFNWEDVERMKKKFFKGSPTDEILIFLFMAIPVVPSVLVSAVCGAIRLPLGEFYLFTFLGLAVRGIILGLLGWWVGETYFMLASGINRAENIVFILLGIALFVILALGYKNRHRFLGEKQ